MSEWRTCGPAAEFGNDHLYVWRVLHRQNGDRYSYEAERYVFTKRDREREFAYLKAWQGPVEPIDLARIQFEAKEQP